MSQPNQDRHHTHESHSIESQIDDLLAQMTLEEKVGQMTMVETYSIEPQQVAEYLIGGLLSGGGGNPDPNTPQNWRKMVTDLQKPALTTHLGIPAIYGSDAVHGHNNVNGAVIFPHNIGLGATRDEELVERIGQITAKECLATSVHWTFAPAVSVPMDIRWGRSYEGFSQDTDLASDMAVALIRGLQGSVDANLMAVLACAKHYVADGATDWGSKQAPGQAVPDTNTATADLAHEAGDSLGQWQIDQGIANIDEAELRAKHLPPYIAAIEAGVQTVMVSYSSWDDLKMHAQHYLLTDVLKDELGFDGLVVSDWMGIDHIDPDYYTCVVTSINAGLDMIMVPYDFRRFIMTLLDAVRKGDVSEERIDDAVRRILRVKFAVNLFDNPFGDESLLELVGSLAHRTVAREAVRKSLVLLKNELASLPLPKDLPALLVAGQGADDIGIQCGGWSISWQGEVGATTTGTTILDGIRDVVSQDTALHYSPDGVFGEDVRAEVGIVVLHEPPYAEGFGDRFDLTLTDDHTQLIDNVRSHCEKLIVILIAGRPLIITDQLPKMDAFVMAWLPGTEGKGIADVLFGDYPFAGKLPFYWARSMEQIPYAAMASHKDKPLFEIGDGLVI